MELELLNFFSSTIFLSNSSGFFSAISFVIEVVSAILIISIGITVAILIGFGSKKFGSPIAISRIIK